MANLEYRKRGKFSSKILGLVIIVGFYSAYHFHFKEKMLGNENTSHNKPLLNKEEHLRTHDEWKQIVDIRANEYYKCMKDLDMDYSKNHLSSSCSNTYRNQYVKYREGLETRANLNFSQIRGLLDYWDEESDAIRDKAIKAMEENERNKRPNKYD